MKLSSLDHSAGMTKPSLKPCCWHCYTPRADIKLKDAHFAEDETFSAFISEFMLPTANSRLFTCTHVFALTYYVPPLKFTLHSVLLEPY